MPYSVIKLASLHGLLCINVRLLLKVAGAGAPDPNSGHVVHSCWHYKTILSTAIIFSFKLRQSGLPHVGLTEQPLAASFIVLPKFLCSRSTPHYTPGPQPPHSWPLLPKACTDL
ncbi:hypothetical protein E2C01_037550 [Portunus trituberculatus]|uniref:Uncharacterized protein n=1 Tax=Portunus trituberculatus TaxID=210409 RepID=A0A5B7FED6_PORTR|nr:hypothetical protein [Portunus trituberculatus]